MGNKDSCFTHMFLSFLYLSPHLSLISLQFPCAFKLLVKLKENSKHEIQFQTKMWSSSARQSLTPQFWKSQIFFIKIICWTPWISERSLRQSSSILCADIKDVFLDCTYLLINHLVFFLRSLQVDFQPSCLVLVGGRLNNTQDSDKDKMKFLKIEYYGTTFPPKILSAHWGAMRIIMGRLLTI